MYSEHKETVKTEVLPVLSEIEKNMGKVDPILRKIRKMGTGADMTKITIVISNLENAVASVKSMEAVLNELLWKQEVKAR